MDITKIAYKEKTQTTTIHYSIDGHEFTAKYINQKPHPDFLLALECLVVHLVESCEQKPCLGYKVTGVAITDSLDLPGVTIIGRKKLQSKRVLNMASPFIPYDEDKSFYKHTNELYLHMESLEKEAKAMILDQKFAQQSLDLTQDIKNANLN